MFKDILRDYILKNLRLSRTLAITNSLCVIKIKINLILRNMNTTSDSHLNQKFLEELQNFTNFVLTNSRTYTLTNNKVNGERKWRHALRDDVCNRRHAWHLRYAKCNSENVISWLVDACLAFYSVLIYVHAKYNVII